MILTVQQAIVTALTSPTMTANVDAVNGKFSGTQISAPTVANIYEYVNDTARWDKSGTVVFVVPQDTSMDYSSSNRVKASHRFYVAFIMRDASPVDLNDKKLMITEAAVPMFNASIRDGQTRYNCYIDRIDYEPQYADGQFNISDVVLTITINEFIPSEEVQV